MILYDWPANARFGVYAGHYTTHDDVPRDYVGIMRRNYRALRRQGADPGTIRRFLNAATFLTSFGDARWVADLRKVRS